MKACVKTKQELTEFFNCTIENRQRCMLSPFLFYFYIGELVQMLKDSGFEGTFVNVDFTDIKILLYADDLGLKKDIVCTRFPTDPIKTCATQIYFMDFKKKIFFFRKSISKGTSYWL